MIEVTVKLISAVHPSRSRILGVATIANTGEIRKSGKPRYVGKFSKWAPKENETWKWNTFEVDEVEVVDFDNVKRGPWDLLYLALRAIVAKRNLENTSVPL